MIRILHGDHEIQIYKELSKLLENSKTQGAEVVRLSAKKLTIPSLEIALGTEALFISRRIIIIEGLLSLPKSNLKNSLLSLVTKHDNSELEIVLVEKKALTALQLKGVPNAEVSNFKYPSILFSWLEGVGVVPAKQSSQLLHKLLETEDEQLVLIMLTRQVRTLISYAFDGIFIGLPFLRPKVANQAKHIGKERLLRLHTALLELDEKQKSSSLSMSLVANLDLLLTLV